MDGGEGAGDRRQFNDRRERGDTGTGGRRGAQRSTSRLAYVLRALGAVVVLVLVIVLTLRSMNPVYATRGKLGDELRKRAPGAAAAIGAFDSTNVDRLMATAKFQDEKRNFFEDVMRLKQVDSARADSIAQYAVREAYVRGISPALIFGVMLTENSRFISKATSNVGAVGLMQVYPKVWLTKEMTRLFGRDLSTDSTNVKYGVFILSHYFNPRNKKGETRERDWATALLRYNGCVRGTNTPRCHTYPNKVQGFVEKQATSICDGRPFYDCIAKPFIEGLFAGGRLAKDTVRTVTGALATADSGGAATVAAAGEVTQAGSVLIVVPPVVVSTPESLVVAPAAPVMSPMPPASSAATNRRPIVSKATPARPAATKPAKAKAAPPKAAPRKAVPRKTTTAKPTKKKAPVRRTGVIRPSAMPKAPAPITITLP